MSLAVSLGKSKVPISLAAGVLLAALTGCGSDADPSGDGTNGPVLSNEEQREFVEQAVAELEAKTMALEVAIHSDEAAWSLDQDEGTIVFERPDGMRATAPVQIIGTYNTDDGTWLWAWDHPSVNDSLRKDASTVLKYGQEHDIAPLTTRKISCQETDCWEFTAIACKLCDAQAAYRGLSGNTGVYMTLGQVRLSAKED